LTKIGNRTASSGGEATTLGGGTPDTGCTFRLIVMTGVVVWLTAACVVVWSCPMCPSLTSVQWEWPTLINAGQSLETQRRRRLMRTVP